MKRLAEVRQLALAALLGFSVAAAQAGTVSIDDQAGILGDSQSAIQTAAAKSPFPVRVLTRNNAASKDDLDHIVNEIGRANSKGIIVIGVDSKLRHLHVAANNAYLNSNDVTQAEKTAGAHFKNQKWGDGFSAAISELASKSASGQVTASSSRKVGSTAAVPATSSRGAVSQPQHSSGGGLPWGWIILGGIGLVIFMVVTKARRSAPDPRFYNGPVGSAPPPPPGGYPPGGYPQGGGYGPGYGAPPPSGGLGAVGGGLLGGLGGAVLGYELGKHSGGGHHDGGYSGGSGGGGGYDPGPGADYSSGSSDAGGFVSGSSDAGDFGGGGGGGGDFGGGGGDFGGGGSSGDF